ncbi:MAG: beta-lactamase family protein [Planctomycetes bacterium]|nr:beta-lactamase family protein [Planctomycetota bacterium]
MRTRELLHLALFALCFAGLPRATAQERASSSAAPDAWGEVRAHFEQRCRELGVVGAGLVFVRGAEIAGHAVHGFADRASERRVDERTIFHWASCTKTLTAIAVMQLRDRGALRLEQPIVELLPELRAVHSAHGPIAAVTLRHLLTHSAGFRAGTWPWGGDQPWQPFEPTEWSQLVAMLPYTQLEFAPGTRYSYSNPGIVFLGRALELTSGEPYESYLEKNVLRPLGLAQSYFDRTPYHLQRHRSHGYDGSGESARDLGPEFDTGITVSNSGWNAPLGDLARYLAFLLGALPPESDAMQVLARSTLAEMWRKELPTGVAGESIGLGFFVHELAGTPCPTHTGTQRGFCSFFYAHPASGTGVAAAFNTSAAAPLVAELRSLCQQRLSLPLAKAR